MSASPQIRLLFMELLEKERPFFTDGRGVIDKDNLLYSILDTMRRDYPQQATLYRAEAENMAGRVLLNEHLRFHQTAFIQGEIKRRSRQYVQIPLEGTNKFVSKLQRDMTKRESRRMAEFHRKRGGSENRKADWYDLVVEVMDEAGLSDDARMYEVMDEIPDEAAAV